MAPSGYGKTVLAAQLARTERFQTVVWIDGRGQELRGQQLLEFVVAELDSPVTDVGQSDLLLPRKSADDVENSLYKILDRIWGRNTCLVIDNLAELNDWSALSRIRQILSRAASADHCLIVTSWKMGEVPQGVGTGWLLEADDLRLSQEEGDELARRLYGSDLEPTTVRGLLSSCSGHAALFAVLARHHRLRVAAPASSVAPASHLRQQLQYLAATHLSPLQRSGLTAASLLSTGTANDIQAVLDQPFSQSELRQLSECIPLIRVARSETGTLEFDMHDLGRAVFAKSEGTKPCGFEECTQRALGILASRGEYSRLFELALLFPEVANLPGLLEQHGRRLLDVGGASLLRRALESTRVEVLVQRPALLLLHAQLEQYLGNYREAASKARIAADLAHYAAKDSTSLAATLLLGRALLASGDARQAREVLEPVASNAQLGSDPDGRLLLWTNLGLASTHLGDGEAAEQFFGQARLLEEAGEPLSDRANAYKDGATGFYCCTLLGDFARGLSLFSRHMRSTSCSPETRLPSMGNAALAMCHRGSLHSALELINEVLAQSDSYSSNAWRQAWLGSRASILAGLGDYRAAESDAALAIGRAEERDECDAHYLRAERSAWRRAAGDLDGAFADSEAAREFLQSVYMVHGKWLAEAELAANLLALGDPSAAGTYAEGVLRAAGVAAQPCLDARLVLAERARQAGEFAVATDALVASVDYILSGNGNWVTAMYIRAFPGLLGIVAAAVGADRIPAHLLRMILPENAEKALPIARDVLPEDEWRTLATRLLGESELDKLSAEPETASVCRVRLFGGLEVEIAGSRVADAAWRKRKARLLFAMLVVRKGRDVPREQLLEYLWPEMDAQRAVANFYVVWNNMKNALCPDLPKGQALPYARTAGGVCRLDDLLVTSDLDDFERSLSEIRRGEGVGDRDAISSAAHRLADIYRGDLLPGDIYDDWFAPLRERCRQEFGDGMLRAARVLEEDGSHVAALEMVRTALSHDAWREDLYQAALRCQIAVGQRSAAIDTYMTCMRKLSDDLGLDPSAETRKLYERVLAMEHSAEEGYSV
ncbi:MAG TPA: BTAD domain-containing putative transcriptional regulator [Coriobacteriia bacterium]